MDEKTIARFLRLVDRRGPDECWPWLGAPVKDGYGLFYVGPGKRTGAHRFAWSLANDGADPGDAEILHSCDNPPCCNPTHLSPGTHADNMTDMIRRRRPRTLVITDEVVRKIRELRAANKKLSEIAATVGTTKQQVSRIARGGRFKHVV